MSRYTTRNEKNNDNSIQEKTFQNKTKSSAINQASNNPPRNVGYYTIINTKQPDKKEISTKYQTITAGKNYVSSTIKYQPSNESVKKSTYSSSTMPHPSHLKSTKKPYEINII